MNDFIKILTRKNSLRKQCHDMGIPELEKVVSDLNDIIEEKRAEEAERARILEAKAEAIKAIREQMREAGINLDELVEQVDTGARKGVKAKYQIEDENGEKHYWSGRGRTPVLFAQYMEKHNITKDQLPTVN